MRARYISVSCCDVKRPSANAAAISTSDISAGGSAEAARACVDTAPAAAVTKKSRRFINKHPQVRRGAYSNPYFLRDTGNANLTQHYALIQGLSPWRSRIRGIFIGCLDPTSNANTCTA